MPSERYQHYLDALAQNSKLKREIKKATRPKPPPPPPKPKPAPDPEPALTRQIQKKSTNHKPTENLRRQVRVGVGLGMTHEQVAMIVGLKINTLERHYRRELKIGKSQIFADISGAMYNIARNEDHPKCVSAATFILKTQFGWREVQRLEVGGVDGAPIEIQARDIIDSRALSYEQRQEFRHLLLTATQAAITTPAIDAEFEDREVESDEEEDYVEEDDYVEDYVDEDTRPEDDTPGGNHDDLL